LSEEGLIVSFDAEKSTETSYEASKD